MLSMAEAGVQQAGCSTATLGLLGLCLAHTGTATMVPVTLTENFVHAPMYEYHV